MVGFVVVCGYVWLCLVVGFVVACGAPSPPCGLKLPNFQAPFFDMKFHSSYVMLCGVRTCNFMLCKCYVMLWNVM